MLLYVLGFVFSLLGIIGYFLEISAFIVVAFIYILAEALIGLYTGELRSIGTYVFAVVIGFLVAIFTKTNIFLTIIVALCFEEFTMGVISIIFLIISIMGKKHQDKRLYNYSYKVDIETRRMIRLIKNSVPNEAEAQRIIEEYFNPVLKALSDVVHTMNEYRNRVRGLHLSREVKNGNRATEAYAVQIFGKVKSYIDAFCEEDCDDLVIDGKTLKEWQAVLLKFKEMNPNIDYKKIIESSRELSDLYSELFMRLDMVAMEMYLEPIFAEENYFPHPCLGVPEKVIAEYGNLFGVETEVFPVRSKSPVDVQSYVGFSSLYDAVEVIDRYIEPIAVMIHLSPSIEKLFVFEREFCQMSSPEDVTKRIDEINTQGALDECEKRMKIREICKTAPSSLPTIMSELSRYIDLVICLDMKKFFSKETI